MKGENLQCSTSLELRLCVRIIFFGFLYALIFAFCMHLMGYGWPYNTFLFKPQARFSDFFTMRQAMLGMAPYQMGAIYFPLAFWIILPFTFFSRVFDFLIFNGIFLGFTFWLFVYYTKNFKPMFKSVAAYHGVLAIFFLSYPVLFAIDRGNFEMLLFVFVALFLVCFQQKRFVLSAFFLAVAIGIKGYPAVFLILFLKEKQYRSFFIGIALVFLLTLAALASFKGGLMDNIHWYLSNMESFQHKYILSPWILNTASLFSAVKVAIWYASDRNLAVFFRVAIEVLPYYTWFVSLLFVLIAVYVLWFQKVLWKNVALLVFVIIMFPTTSYDYKLLYLFLPFLLFLTRQNPDSSGFSRCYLILFAFLFIPKNYYVFLPSDASINNFLNIGIMLAISGLIFYEHFREYYAVG